MRKIKWFNIFVTRGCNLKCSFCNEHKFNSFLELSNIDSILDFLKYLYKYGYKIENLKFFGGESLLNFPFIEEFVNRFDKKIGYDYRTGEFIDKFRITTNGLLLDNKKIDFLNKKKIRINVSMNGPLSVYNKDRNLNLGKNDWDKFTSNLTFIDQDNLFMNFNVSPVCVENGMTGNFEYVLNFSRKINFLPIYFQHRSKDQLYSYLKGIQMIKRKYGNSIYWENIENYSHMPLHNRGININTDMNVYSSSIIVDADMNDNSFNEVIKKIFIGQLKGIDIQNLNPKLDYNGNREWMNEIMDKIYSQKTENYRKINYYLDKGIENLIY